MRRASKLMPRLLYGLPSHLTNSAALSGQLGRACKPRNSQQRFHAQLAARAPDAGANIGCHTKTLLLSMRAASAAGFKGSKSNTDFVLPVVWNQRNRGCSDAYDRCLHSFYTKEEASSSGHDDADLPAMPPAVAQRFHEAIKRADLGQPPATRKGEPPQTDANEGESWQDIAAHGAEVRDKQKHRSHKLPQTSTRALQKARLFEDDEHSIRGVHIPRSAWSVLLRLRAAGHEGYIVGGAVRDLLLKGTPKDFDILTSATIAQVKKLLHRAIVIGRRFPIIHVTVGGETLEVSSFATGVSLADLPFDAAALLGSKNAQLGSLSSTQGRGLLWKVARQQNAASRDFTVNALMYDPFSRVIFDYTDGVTDLRRKVLRTIVDPEESFARDPARMLRAVRLAARAGLKIEDGTAKAITKCQQLVWGLPQGRLMMEVQSLLGYGSAEASMKLLWKYGLLDLMFPVLCDYLKSQRYPRNPRKQRSELLFQLLKSMDVLASPDKPLPPSVWFAVLAMPVLKDLGRLQTPGKGSQNSTGASERRRDEDAHAIRIKDASSDDESWDIQTGAETGQPEQNREDLEADRRPPYIQAASDVVDAFLDRPQVSCLPKSNRDLVLKILTEVEKRRLHIHQEVSLPCSSCDNVEKVPLSMEKIRVACGACGSALPTRTLRKRRSPEVKAVISVLDALQ